MVRILETEKRNLSEREEREGCLDERVEGVAEKRVASEGRGVRERRVVEERVEGGGGWRR